MLRICGFLLALALVLASLVFSSALAHLTHHPMRTLIVIVSLLFAALAATYAQAHAVLVRSTVRSAPHELTLSFTRNELTLSFTQNLVPVFSTVEVFNSVGARVNVRKPRISGNTMRVAVKSLPPGTYQVRWHALSVNAHTREGSLSFRVG